jgi:diguanylate cyclase (GGDEF)-like protein
LDNIKSHLIEYKLWNRKIINAFWIVSFIYIIGQVIFLTLDIINVPGYSIKHFLLKYMFVPDSIILLILICTELFFRFSKRLEKHLIIITSLAIAYTAFFNISSSISGRQLALLMPILISIFYFNKKILAVTCSISISIIWIVYMVSPYQRKIMSIYELVIVTVASIIAGVIGIGVVNRGIELLDSITTLVKNEQKLIIEKSIIDKLSKTDALTNLYNHRTFHEYVDTILNQHNLYNFQVQLALIDIDNFKKVNDTYGHWTGDIVLKGVGSILQNSVTADDFVARYGGEEFAVIFIDKNLSETLSILDKIKDAIENNTFEELENNSVTVSIGVHNYLNNEGKELLFKYADGALYDAKCSGKNKVLCNP